MSPYVTIKRHNLGNLISVKKQKSDRLKRQSNRRISAHIFILSDIQTKKQTLKTFFTLFQNFRPVITKKLSNYILDFSEYMKQNKKWNSFVHIF